MAAEFTRIQDIVEPTHFAELVRERTAEKSNFVQSGVVATDPLLDQLADAGGRTVDLAFWQDIPGDAEADTDQSVAIEPDRRLQAEVVARKFYFRKALGFTDVGIETALNQSDPAADLAERFAEFWSRQDQKLIVMPTLIGLFDPDGPLGSGATAPHIHDIAIEAGESAADTNLIGSDAIIDANNLLGDSWDSVGALVMHSKPFSRLQKMDLVEFEPVSGQNIRIATYQGKRVIVDDGCRVVAGGTNGFKYYTYLLGLGSFGMGVGNPRVPVEIEREGLKSQESVIVRRRLYLHPFGISYDTSASTGLNPTTGELGDDENWTLVREHKNVPMVALVTNG